MQRHRLLLILAIAVLAPALLVMSALADLRSPEGTAALGAGLAADPAVQTLLVDAVVDAVLADIVDRGPATAPLVMFVRPLLADAVEATIATPAGRAAVSVALTEALRQLTVAGPIVIDLRPAALAAAEEAPPPLDTLARAAVAQGLVGLIVLGSDEDADVTGLAAPEVSAGRVGGLPGGTAVVLVALLLAGAVAGLLLPADTSRRRRLIGAGGVLTGVGALGVLVLRTVPGLVVRASTTSQTDGPDLAAVLPMLLDGLAGLLTRTTVLGIGFVVAGVTLLAASRLAAGPPGTRG